MINKKASEVFGMSFNMIFSIILIVFFVVIAFIGIKAFLSWQSCSNTHLLLTEIEDDIKEAFYSNGYTGNQSYSVPAGIEYVCFLNTSEGIKSASTTEQRLYRQILDKGFVAGENLFLYSPGKDLCTSSKKIRFVDQSSKNPICFKVIEGKMTMRIERETNYRAVVVSE